MGRSSGMMGEGLRAGWGRSPRQENLSGGPAPPFLRACAEPGLASGRARPSYDAMSDDSPPVPALARRGRVRLRTLITVRWIGIAGQVAALAIVHYGLGFPLPIAGAAVAVAASAGLNLWLASWRRGSTLLSDRMAAVQLG